MSNTVRFAGVPSYVSASAKTKAKQVLWDWLDTDGFQEGADGASAIIAIVWGNSTVEAWIEEHRMKERQAGMETANAR